MPPRSLASIRPQDCADADMPVRSPRRWSNASSRKARLPPVSTLICAIHFQIAAMPRSDSSQHVAPGTIRGPASLASKDKISHGPVLYTKILRRRTATDRRRCCLLRVPCARNGRAHARTRLCGTGRITLALAERGFDITGIDVSDGMLTMARRKAAGRPASVRDRLTFDQSGHEPAGQGSCAPLPGPCSRAWRARSRVVHNSCGYPSSLALSRRLRNSNAGEGWTDYLRRQR